MGLNLGGGQVVRAPLPQGDNSIFFEQARVCMVNLGRADSLYIENDDKTGHHYLRQQYSAPPSSTPPPPPAVKILATPMRRSVNRT